MSDSQRNSAWYQRIVPDVLRRRFTAKFFAIVVVAMLITGGAGVYFYQQSTQTLDEQVNNNVQSTADLQANALENWVDGLESETRMISRAGALQSGDISQIDQYFQSASFRSDIAGIYYISAADTEILSSRAGNLDGLAFSDTSATWVDRLDSIDRNTDNASSVVVSDTPSSSPSSGADVIAFISSVPGNTSQLVVVEASVSSRSGTFAGSSSASYTTVHDPDTKPGQFVYDGTGDGLVPSNLTELNTSGTIDDEVLGYSVVPGTDWTVVSHIPKEQAFSLRNQIETSLIVLIALPLLVIGGAAAVVGRRTGNTLKRLTKRAESVGQGDLDTEFETTRIDEFGRLTNSLDDMRVSIQDRIDEAERARKEAEVSRSEAMELSNYLQERADEYAQIMQECGAGDLTQRMAADGENEAMDRIANEFNDMVDELEKTTGQLKSFADEVETAGVEVQQSADTVREASEQVAESIQRISDDAYDQRDRLQEVTETIDGIATDLEAFAEEHPEVDFDESLEKIEATAGTLSEIVDLSEETMGEAENVAGAAEEQAAELNEVSERASDLSRYARPLREVLDRFETESEHEFYFPTGPGSDAEEN